MRERNLNDSSPNSFGNGTVEAETLDLLTFSLGYVKRLGQLLGQVLTIKCTENPEFMREEGMNLDETAGVNGKIISDQRYV